MQKISVQCSFYLVFSGFSRFYAMDRDELMLKLAPFGSPAGRVVEPHCANRQSR
jgi:hypothetical protein